MTNKIIPIVLPKWGLSMKEGTIGSWLKEEGSKINESDALVEIETEKIVNEYDSPEIGTLRKIIAQTGEKLPVGSLIAVLADKNISDDEINNFIKSFQEKFVQTQNKEVYGSGLDTEFFKLDKKIIRFLKVGSKENKKVLFIHGFGSDLSTWALNQGSISEKNITYALDLPGHGGSYKEIEKPNIDFFSNYVVQFCSYHNISKINLVGQSMGGAISLYCALQNPNLVNSLTLICPTSFGKDINMEYIDGFIKSEKRNELRPYLEKLFSNPENITKNMINDVLKNKRLDGAKQALKNISLSFFSEGYQSVFLKSRLNELKIKVSVIWGKNDNILPESHSQDLPNSVEKFVLDDSGHMVHIEKSEEVNKIILNTIS